MSSQNGLITKWVERRRLAEALCRLQRVVIGAITPGMARAFFSALATCRTVELKSLTLLNALPCALCLGDSPGPGLVAKALLRVQNLDIRGTLGPAHTTILLMAVSQQVGQLKSLALGCKVPFPVGIKVETVAMALNQVERLHLDLRGHTSFQDYLCLQS